MVAIGIDTRRHAAEVYGSSDGRQWVLREDYEALMKKATLTVDECHAAGCIVATVKRLIDHANALTDEERVVVAGWLDTFGKVVVRLAE